MKGLYIEVYKSKYDATNGGVTALVTDAIIVGPDMPALSEANAITRPALRVVERKLFGSIYRHLEPIEPGQYMFGGNLGYSSDSRFPNEYPLKIHDRQENSKCQKLY